MHEGMEKVGVWERVDCGVYKFQYPEGRGAPPPDQIYRRVTFFYDPADFEREKRSGLVWENHEGDLTEDRRLGGEIEVERRAPLPGNRFRFRVRACRACGRGEAAWAGERKVTRCR